MFHHKGIAEKPDFACMEDNSGELAEEPKARIQKISQEGSKSTYVIIVNKDCLKSESAKRNISSIKQAPVLGHGRCVPRRSLVQGPDIRRNLTDISDKDFDSPTPNSTASLVKGTTQLSQEDVKLNLTDINDDEYDSGLSASSVFLKSENSSAAFDSAIEIDVSQNSSNLEGSLKSKNRVMNSYVIPSPLTVQQKKTEEIQHVFPVISSQLVDSKGAPSKLAYSTPVLSDKTASHPTARKIFLVPDTCSSSESSMGGSKRMISYTSPAVPIANKNFGTPVNIGYQRPVNPNAVPIFNDISPIQAAGDSKFSPVPTGKFLPVQPSSNIIQYPSDNKGPLTSTPVLNTNPRLAQLKQESSSHRSVYIIQSPFSRRKSDSNSNSSSVQTNTVNIKNEETGSNICDTPGSGQLNNSSGFLSASDSLEQTDSSSLIQITNVRSLADSKNDATDVKLSNSVDASKETFSPAVSSEISEPGSEVIKLEDGESDTGVGTESELEPSVSSSQESEAGENFDKGCLNRSLTNIQWLKGMQLKEEKGQSSSSSSHSQHQTIQWKCLTPEDIKKISEECGREKRPPFSYMSLIQMALYSREDRKMMLKEICKWIEDTFPYYRHCGKQGWKNSIRHNLSLYNIFVREPAKRHGAYWTIKPNLEPKTKQYKDRHSGQSSSSSDTHQSMPSLPSQTPGMIPIIPMYSSMGQLSAISPQSLLAQPQTNTATGAKKKGPLPILPRPSPYGTTSPYAPQAYALIPLQSMNQQYSINPSVPQSPVIVNLPSSGQTMSACPSPVISEMSAAVASIQVSCASPIPPDGFDSQVSHGSVMQKGPINIVKQAWLDTQNMDTYSSMESDLTSSNDIASSNEYMGISGNRAKVKRSRTSKPGLPKPKMYHEEKVNSKKSKGGSKRRKLQQERALQESSDEEDEGSRFLSKLEKDLTTPLKMLATSDNVVEELLTTSTPFKNINNSGSPTLPSPIRGLTPLRSAGVFDGSFLDLIDKKAMSPDLGDKKYSPESAMKLSPNTSLDFNVLDKVTDSPDSNTSFNNQNLSRFLNEYCIDPNLAESAENFPNLNWSVVQQMVDSMDTDQT